MRQTAEQAGFQFVFVDAAETKLHLIDKLFHAVARQIDWDALARAYLRQVLQQPEMGLQLPPPPAELTLSSLAPLNDMPAPRLRLRVEGWVAQQLYQEYTLSQEFRLAMLPLCLGQFDPGDNPAVRQAVTEWLHGELRLLSAVKPAGIFQKVARHNARHLLFSLAHWLKLAGKSGLVLALDIARYADTRRPSERGAGFYYSLTTTLDLYEVLRQLIDASDELAYGFVGVIAGPESLTDDKRGLARCQALHMRVANEVRDRYRINPLAALVRLEDQPEEAWAMATAARAEEG